MDFKDQIKQLGERALKLKPQILTEESTKNALIMPFIQCLGYDVFNPLEVHPEYISDVGTKKGEKIDYAIMKENVPIILIECKHWAQNLDLHDGQLLRYFHVSKARFGILTNGLCYRFYTDLVQPNKMDEKPFLEFEITDMKDNQIEELKKFHKSYFDLEKIINTAEELKYTNELKTLLSQELNNPTEMFTKYFARQVYPGFVTQKVYDHFAILLKKSINNYISDLITDRLKSALASEAEKAEVVETSINQTTEEQEPKVVTTQEELDGFYIVKAIVRQKVDISRIFYRDGQAYFSIILDDNNRKPICKLYLNGKKKYIGLFNDQKNETKIELNKLDDLFSHSASLLDTVDKYEKQKN